MLAVAEICHDVVRRMVLDFTLEKKREAEKALRILRKYAMARGRKT